MRARCRRGAGEVAALRCTGYGMAVDARRTRTTLAASTGRDRGEIGGRSGGGYEEDAGREEHEQSGEQVEEGIREEHREWRGGGAPHEQEQHEGRRHHRRREARGEPGERQGRQQQQHRRAVAPPGRARRPESRRAFVEAARGGRPLPRRALLRPWARGRGGQRAWGAEGVVAVGAFDRPRHGSSCQGKPRRYRPHTQKPKAAGGMSSASSTEAQEWSKARYCARRPA